MALVRPTSIPASSALARLPEGWATWVDAWEAPLTSRDASALDLFATTMGRQPRWLDAALRLRDRIGRFFGIRSVGAFAGDGETAPSASIEVGDRLGIFTVLAVDDDELLVGEDDVHLDYRLAFHRDLESGRFVVAMALRTHNLVGRLYMLPVAPVHRHLVRNMLRGAVERRDI